MAPDIVEFIHKIMYFLGSHGEEGFTDLICSRNVTSFNKVRGSTGVTINPIILIMPNAKLVTSDNNFELFQIMLEFLCLIMMT